MIALAYGLSMDMIVGQPNWMATGDRFDLEAKVEDPRSVTESQLLSMLQALLVDRFELKFHGETHEMPGFALVVAKDGPKLRESESSGDRNLVLTAGGSEGGPHRGDQPDAVKHGAEGMLMTLVGQKLSTTDLAGALSPFAHGHVLDETHLTGLYDVKLTWESGESLSSPLQGQLGLRLEPRKVPVKFFIIDHAEKPETN
jgi:uncharacterized protein (TIGR03435 family)